MRNRTDWTNAHIASPYDESPDAEVASEEEISQVINSGQVPPSQRFNPNMVYADVPIKLGGHDQVLLEAIQRAIDNGWAGWQTRVNDATTIGMEARSVVMQMKKTNADVKGLLFDHDFARYVFGSGWEDHLKEMAVSNDIMEYLNSCLHTES